MNEFVLYVYDKPIRAVSRNPRYTLFPFQQCTASTVHALIELNFDKLVGILGVSSKTLFVSWTTFE